MIEKLSKYFPDFAELPERLLRQEKMRIKEEFRSFFFPRISPLMPCSDW